MINKTLHICWFGPHDPPTALIDSWFAKHGPATGWEVAVHRDHNAFNENKAQIERRAQRREWNGVCDVIRWEILVRFGGVVVDADSECMETLDDRFLTLDAWACFENEIVRPGVIACGAMGGVQGAPIFKSCMEEAGAADGDAPAWKVVGPMLLTRVATQFPGQLRVFPARMFNPVHHSGTAAPGQETIFATQKWGGTKGYNVLRRFPCQCDECRVTALRPPWG
jgi:hypothetical protein